MKDLESNWWQNTCNLVKYKLSNVPISWRITIWFAILMSSALMALTLFMIQFMHQWKENKGLFILGGVVFIIVAIFVGYEIVYRGLKPIRQLTLMAQEIGESQDLTKRIDSFSNNDELNALEKTFNFMLDRLESSAEREKRFTADVSHELRTPLTVIQAESDYAREYINDIDEAKLVFNNIYNKCKFMSNMVAQLLELTRLENSWDIPRVRFNLSELVADIAEDYEKICRAHDSKIMPDIEPNIYINGDKVLMRRAIMNLMDNARKFTEDLVGLSLHQIKDKIIIKVWDNGRGLKTEEMKYLFDRLYQTEYSRNRYNNKGIGLGLYFVKNIIDLHDGITTIESTPNCKTEFSIILQASST